MLNRTTIILSALYAFTWSNGFASHSNSMNNENPKEDHSLLRTSPTSSRLSINSYKYTTAIGVRGFGTSGITIKHFTSSTNAIEGILGLWPDAFSATVLFEKHTQAFSEPGLNWYYGVGGHISTKSDWAYQDSYRSYERTTGEVGLGIDGVCGVEYKIREIPIAVSFDLKPFLEVTTKGHAYLALDPGLGIKVTF